MMNTELLSALDQERIIRVSGFADTSRGMAEIFEDRPTSASLGIFTVVFAERFCNETPGYVWRKI